MARKPIHSDDAPKAIGPYSQAIQVEAGKMTFLSGQIPLDPRRWRWFRATPPPRPSR